MRCHRHRVTNANEDVKLFTSKYGDSGFEAHGNARPGLVAIDTTLTAQHKGEGLKTGSYLGFHFTAYTEMNQIRIFLFWYAGRYALPCTDKNARFARAIEHTGKICRSDMKRPRLRQFIASPQLHKYL